jgi:hypothetical protein
MAPGERVTLALKYLGFPVGEGSLTLGVPGADDAQGKWTITTAGEVNVVGLYRASGTLVETWNLSSDSVERSEQTITEQGQSRRESFLFDEPNAKVHIHKVAADGATKDVDHEIVSGTHVVVTAVYSLRATPLLPGSARTFNIFDGKQLKPLTAQALGTRTEQTAFGPLALTEIHIVGEVSTSGALADDLTLWLTDNPTRLPVRITSGSALLEAVDYSYETP